MTSIQCPNCSARLNIKDPALLGKSLRCPKCKQSFRAPEPAAESTGFASLDFNEAPPVENQWSEPEVPAAPAAMWAAPTREVAVVKSKPALSKEDAARQQSRREFSLLMVGGAVCGVLALAVIIVGSIVVWRSMKKNAEEAAAAAANEPVASSDAPAPGSGNLPTVFGFDETRRALLVDYLVSQGNGKPKAKLTMAMVVNALKKLAADFNIEPKDEFPEQLELLRERVVMRDVPDELLKSDKVPTVFQKMISEYQEKTLGPAEEEVAILVIMAFLGAEM